MAERPVFLPVETGPQLVREVSVAFRWHPGFAAAQKRKNVAALHAAAGARGLGPLLEVSSKSEAALGRGLSAFAPRLPVAGGAATVESAFQGSKVFERGGPFTELIGGGSRAAKRDPRLKESGRLVGFRLEGVDFPLTPATAFYDWIYIRALRARAEGPEGLAGFAGFTDIEFNPKRAVNCQARSCATFLALRARGWVDEPVRSFDQFRGMLLAAEGGRARLSSLVPRQARDEGSE